MEKKLINEVKRTDTPPIIYIAYTFWAFVCSLEGIWKLIP